MDIKKILLALEYTLEGKRLVDYDLYYKNRKVSWVSVTTPKNKKPKIEIAKENRENLYKKLGNKNVATLEEMEEKILKMEKSSRPGF